MDNGNPFKEDRVYTVRELCETLRKSREWVHKAEKSGRIPASVNFPALGKHWPGRWMVEWYDREAG